MKDVVTHMTDRLIGGLQRCFALREIDRPEHRVVVQAAFLIAGFGMLLRAFFWAYTQRYWEDALITCLHSENFFRGIGLTHVVSADDPLHGFTSPLSVLVPMIGDLFHIGFGVEFLKLVSIPASALSIMYLLALGLHPKIRLATPLLLVGMGYLAVEHHQILWGMAGMETQLVVLALLMSLYYTVTLQSIPLGISLGICMLARPDFAFWTVIAGAYVLCSRPKQFLRVVACALAVYLPWIAFTIYYYGSPIPHTILAKGVGFSLPWLQDENLGFFSVKRHTWMTLSEQLFIYLGPVFGGHGAGIHKFFTNGPESPIANLMFAFSALGTVVIVIRRQWALWPLAAFVVVYSVYYVYLVPIIYGWYKVPFAAALLVLALWGVQQVSTLIPKPVLRTRLLAVAGAVYLGLFIVVLPRCFYGERMIQQHIENDIRRAAGEYLNAHMTEDEVVGAEALGYLAYYSQRKVYDWPGLASREVVAWSSEQPLARRSLENMCKDLRPDYLFLRDLEVLYHFESTDWLREGYEVVKILAVDPAIKPEIPWIERSVDPIFRIYKKIHPEVGPSPTALAFPERPPERAKPMTNEES